MKRTTVSCLALSALLSTLSVGISGASRAAQPTICNNQLVVETGEWYTLQADESYDCVEIQTLACLKTNGYTLTITGNSGLESKGTLKIGASGTVVLSGSGTHTIDRPVPIEDKGVVLANATSILSIEKTLTLAGSGNVVGQHPSAKIKIKAGKTLTIDAALTVNGAMQIEGMSEKSENNGTLDNDGLVHADKESGTLQLMRTTRLNGSGGTFKASDFSTAVLQFSRGHPKSGLSCVMSADFIVDDCATLDIDADQRTSGNFTCGIWGGVVDDAGDMYELRYGDCAGSGIVADGCSDCS